MNLTALLWGLLGFLIGYLAGTFWGIKQKQAPVKKTPSRKTATAPPKKRRWSNEQWIGPVVLLLAILMGIQYMYQVNKDREAAECQTQFNQAFAKQLTIRSELASQAQANVDKIILSIGRMVTPDASEMTPAERRQRVTEYRRLFTDFAKESAAIQEKRQNTPLPQLPADGCEPQDTAESTVLAEETARVELLEAQLDASRAAILAQMPGEMEPVQSTTSAAPVRTVVVREPSRTPAPARTEPNDKPSRVIVNVPMPDPAPSAPPAAPPVVQPPATPPAQPDAEQVCTLNLLGICVDL